MKYFIILFVLVMAIGCNTKEAQSQQQYTIPDVQLSSGIIHRIDSFPTNYVQPRTVDVWLPSNYDENKKYKVLYMHDGQMLFDATTTWNKQEWKLDEVASKLMSEGTVHDFIVVAVWNISEIRWQDYYPEKAFEYISEEGQEMLQDLAKQHNLEIKFSADNYLKFLTEELKPYVDRHYSVFTEKRSTFIAGSSMGGLISMYAMFEYPTIFGGAACISTHWPGANPMDNNPFPIAFFQYMKANKVHPETQKFYFDYGTETLDQYYPQYADEVDAIFKEKGFDDSNYKNLKFDGAAHDEVSWAKRLDIPLTFLLAK